MPMRPNAAHLALVVAVVVAPLVDHCTCLSHWVIPTLRTAFPLSSLSVRETKFRLEQLIAAQSQREAAAHAELNQRVHQGTWAAL
jgi:hypothetical protein